jgi:hypothetical protein
VGISPIRNILKIGIEEIALMDVNKYFIFIILLTLIGNEIKAQMLISNNEIDNNKTQIDKITEYFRDKEYFSGESVPNEWEVIQGSIIDQSYEKVKINDRWFYYGTKIATRDNSISPKIGIVGKYYTLFDVVYFLESNKSVIKFQKHKRSSDSFYIRWHYEHDNVISHYKLKINQRGVKEVELKSNNENLKINPVVDKDGPSASFKLSLKRNFEFNKIKAISLLALNNDDNIVSSSKKLFLMKLHHNSLRIEKIFIASDTTLTLSFSDFDARGTAIIDEKIDYLISCDNFLEYPNMFGDFIDVKADLEKNEVIFSFKYITIPSQYLDRTGKVVWWQMNEFYNQHGSLKYSIEEQKLLIQILTLINTNDRNKSNNPNRKSTLSNTTINEDVDFILFIPKSLL